MNLSFYILFYPFFCFLFYFIGKNHNVTFIYKQVFMINDKFTIVVPSFYKRKKFLLIFLNFTLSNPPKSLLEIIINWSSNKLDIEKIIQRFMYKAGQKKILLRYSFHYDTTVNRRFLDAQLVKTSSILSIDDDILMNSDNIEYAFLIWKKHPNQIIGFCERYIKINKRKKLEYAFDGKEIRLILTGISFISRELALNYYHPKNQQINKFVRQINNCEDILMNFVAMNKYNLSAVWIKRKFFHLSKTGISTQPHHCFQRSLCLNKFFNFFNSLPLPIDKNFIYS